MLRFVSSRSGRKSKGKCKISFRGRCVNVRRYSESTGHSEDLTGVMALARDITGYAPPPYDHKINV